MTIKVNPQVLDEIRKYGAFDISACFNCGNCTAVCPLSEENASFPRKMIRYGQIGAREEILKAKEPWLCYYCAECSETCPRQAEPGEYMAAVRRYQIASLDPTGLGKLMYKHTWFAILFSIVTAAALGTLLIKGDSTEVFPGWLFHNLVPYATIHNVGIGVAALLTVLMLMSFFVLIRRSELLKEFNVKNFIQATADVARELGTMKRHGKCGEQAECKTPWHKDQRIIHLAIMWGFLMLLTATMLNFFVIFLAPQMIPGFGQLTVFYPARVIGTIGGLVMLWGVSAAIWKRFTGIDRASATTRFSDAWLLGYLWVLALTGFWLEVVVTVRTPSAGNNWVLLLHAAMAMQLVLFMGMTKLDHVVYRPFMLLKHAMQKRGTIS